MQAREARRGAPLPARDRMGGWGALGVALTITAAITAGHWLTDMHEVAFHNVYRRLYYIPILLAAFARGVPGGVGVALVAVAAYAPHAFFSHHRDPAPEIDKLMEIVLYLTIGALTGWLVGRQRRAQRALERALGEREALWAQLVRAGKLSALGELTAGLAHELRNPLAAIQAGVESLAREFEPPHPKHRVVGLVRGQIDRLDRVVSDFVNFARPSAPARRIIDPHEQAREVVGLMSHRASRHAIDLEVAFGPGEVAVWADPDQLTQALLNLTLNACQAIEEHVVASGAPPEGGQWRVTIVREVRQVQGRAYLALGVRDHGPGVPEALREQIFDPYFTTRAAGCGLGLSISSRLMAAHGGGLEVVSEPGQTTFWIVLPLDEAAQGVELAKG